MQWIARLTAFLVTVAFVPGIMGAATSPRWAVAVLTLYWLHPFTFPFIAFCFYKLEFDQAVHWVIVCGALSVGWRLERTYGPGKAARCRDAIVQAFCLGIGTSSVLAIAQVAGYEGVPQVIQPSGLFLNKNVMGEAAALALVAGVVAVQARYRLVARKERRWVDVLTCGSFLLAPLPAVVLSGSRAAWLATFVGVLALAPRRWFWWSLAGGAALGLLLLWLGINTHVNTLAQRMMIWHDAVLNLTWLGNGSYDYSTVQHREQHLHNDWLQFAYELGLVALVPALVLVVAGRTQLAFVAALLVLGTFGFPLHNPASAWFAAFVVGAGLWRRDDESRTVVRTRLGDA